MSPNTNRKLYCLSSYFVFVVIVLFLVLYFFLPYKLVSIRNNKKYPLPNSSQEPWNTHSLSKHKITNNWKTIQGSKTIQPSSSSSVSQYGGEVDGVPFSTCSEERHSANASPDWQRCPLEIPSTDLPTPDSSLAIPAISQSRTPYPTLVQFHLLWRTKQKESKLAIKPHVT